MLPSILETIMVSVQVLLSPSDLEARGILFWVMMGLSIFLVVMVLHLSIDRRVAMFSAAYTLNESYFR